MNLLVGGQWRRNLLWRGQYGPSARLGRRLQALGTRACPPGRGRAAWNNANGWTGRNRRWRNHHPPHTATTTFPHPAPAPLPPPAPHHTGTDVGRPDGFSVVVVGITGAGQNRQRATRHTGRVEGRRRQGWKNSFVYRGSRRTEYACYDICLHCRATGEQKGQRILDGHPATPLEGIAAKRLTAHGVLMRAGYSLCWYCASSKPGVTEEK